MTLPGILLNPEDKLQEAWSERLKIWAEAQKLQHWAEELQDVVERHRFNAEILRDKANKVWADAILKERGRVRIEWKYYNIEYAAYECHLETGEVFKFD